MEKIKNTSNSFMSIGLGILISLAFTIIMLVIFSCLLVYTDLSEDLINPVIIVLTGISILLGSSIGTKNLQKNGLFKGGIIGLGYIFILYLLSSLINLDFSVNFMSVIMACIGIVLGMIGGIIGINIK